MECTAWYGACCRVPCGTMELIHYPVGGQPLHFNHGQGVQVTIRRSHIIEDGYDTLHTLGPRLKGRVQVRQASCNAVLGVGC